MSSGARTRRLALAFALALAPSFATACAPERAACPAASPLGSGAVTVIAPTPVPSATVAAVVPSSAPLGTGVCWPKGRPSAVAARTKDAQHPFCARLDLDEVARVEARVRKDFVLTDAPSKLVIDFGCDAAYGKARDVFFEDGSGHGGSLRIVRLSPEGGRVVATMIESQHYQLPKSVIVRTAELDARAFEALVKSVRVPLLVRPHLVRMFDPRARSTHTTGGSRTTRDFHLRLTIVDEEGRVLDRGFTGYDGTAAQADILPMTMATEPILKLVAATPFVTIPATDDERRMFTERFAVTLSGDPGWWIRERYVALAAELGTVDAVPHLVGLVKANADAKGEGSELRTLDAAIDAIAKLTGWNPRVDGAGKPRTTAQAAAAVLAECTTAP